MVSYSASTKVFFPLKSKWVCELMYGCLWGNEIHRKKGRCLCHREQCGKGVLMRHRGEEREAKRERKKEICEAVRGGNVCEVLRGGGWEELRKELTDDVWKKSQHGYIYEVWGRAWKKKIIIITTTTSDLYSAWSRSRREHVLSTWDKKEIWTAYGGQKDKQPCRQVIKDKHRRREVNKL